MAKEEKIHDIIDKAIIKSFSVLGAESLQRKAIVKKAHELSRKPVDKIGKRVDERQKEPKDYLVKVSRGIYSKNSKYEFVFEGEPLPGEPDLPGEPEFEPITMVPDDLRRKHTADLHEAINIWMENFPEPPHSKKSFEFFININKCETHLLFSDLCYHLKVNEFDVCEKWESYKASVIKLDDMKDVLLNRIKLDISDMFEGLELKFVNKSYDLNDYECNLPKRIFDNILDYKIHCEVGSAKIKNAHTNEEYDEFVGELMQNICYLEKDKDRIQEMILIEKDNSVIWGETDIMARKIGANARLECIRVPKRDLNAIKGVTDELVSYFKKPPAEIDSLSDGIIKEVIRLRQERDEMLQELERSLYCLSFAGDCKYLGCGSKQT